MTLAGGAATVFPPRTIFGVVGVVTPRENQEGGAERWKLALTREVGSNIVVKTW